MLKTEQYYKIFLYTFVYCKIKLSFQRNTEVSIIPVPIQNKSITARIIFPCCLSHK